MREANYTKLGRFLDWWKTQDKPLTMDELSKHLDEAEILAGIRLGCIGLGVDNYVLKSTVMIDNAFGANSFRFKRIMSDLLKTMRANEQNGTGRKFERTAFVAGLKPEDVAEFRTHAAQLLGPVLIELDQWLTERAVPDGIWAGVSMFQFDDGD